jgi:hypothetical protein
MQMGGAGSLVIPVAIDDVDIDIGTRIDVRVKQLIAGH